MSTYWQTVCNVIAVLGTVVTVAFMWRQDRRESKARAVRLIEQERMLRSGMVSSTITLLYTNLLSIRRIYLHLSEADRLKTELKLIFDKPEVINTISAYHWTLFEFKQYHKMLRGLKLIQHLCSSVSIFFFLGFAVPWVTTLQSDEIALSTGSRALLVGALVAAVAFSGSSIYAYSTGRRLTKLVQHGAEIG